MVGSTQSRAVSESEKAKQDHRYPWLKSYPAACRWDAPILTTTLPAMVDDAAARWGERPAVNFLGHRLNFRQIRDRSVRLAAGLLQRRLTPEMAIAVYMPNTPYHQIALFALTRIGVRQVNLSPLDAYREIEFKLKDSGARTMMILNRDEYLAKAQRLLDEGALDQVIVADESEWDPASAEFTPHSDPRIVSLSDVMTTDEPAAWPVITKDMVAVLQYTGGTTGHPKAAMLSHANLTAAIDIAVHWKDEVIPVPGEERVIGVLPLFHSYAMLFLTLRQFREGNEVYLHRRFDVESVIQEIETSKITIFPGVPTMWIAIANHPGAENRDFSSLRLCISGGAPMPTEVARRVETTVGQRMLGGWGLTEASPVGTEIPVSAAMRPGLIGVPQPGIELQVVSLDDPRQALPPNEVGELKIRGPNITKGYWNRPEENAKSFIDGYFLTGDIGIMDEHGLFALVDRKKSLIISSGFNIYPTTVENAIYEHPDVAEVLVIGVPDSYKGQAVKAFVTLRESAPPLALEDLREFLKERVGRHEMPVALEIRDALPRSAAGKLLRRALEEQESAGAASVITQ
jgi:long-chain acyl-CoA synthetase